MRSDAYEGLIDALRKDNQQLENQLHLLKPFRDLVYHIASKRQDNVDDYIMLAKQAIADYESATMLFALNPDLEVKS